MTLHQLLTILLSAFVHLPAESPATSETLQPPVETAETVDYELVVYLREDRDWANVQRFINTVNQGRDAPLMEAIAFAKEARRLVRHVPNAFQTEAGSIHHLRRYVILDYKSPQAQSAALTQLREDARVGFVGRFDSGLSAAPNDRYYAPLLSIGFVPEQQRWAFQQIGLEAARDYGPGIGTVGVTDYGIERDHPDLQQNIRNHQSYDYQNNDADFNEDLVDGAFRGHGTHMAGLIAADTDNGQGTAGACGDCSLMVTKALATGNRVEAFLYMAGNGAQVLSLSGFELDPITGQVPEACADVAPAFQHPMCAVIDLLKARDIAFVAASGNDLGPVNFPAREPYVWAIGGTDKTGDFWDDRTGLICPLLDLAECGSNSGPQQDFILPAKQVLSTFYAGHPWQPELGASDDYFNPNTRDLGGSTLTQGYDYLTGTSASTTLMAGTLGVIRGLQPLMDVDRLKKLLVDSATNQGFREDVTGYGIPNADAAVERILGQSDGVQQINRMTPMFGLYSHEANSHLFTTRPQVASAAVAGTLNEPANSLERVHYDQGKAGWQVAGYDRYPMAAGVAAPEPWASFYVFTTPHNPFDSQTPLLALTRLSFSEPCRLRDYAYAFGKDDIDFFNGSDGPADWCPSQLGDQVYQVDGIEGYIFDRCPPGFTCDDFNDPASPQSLHRRYSPVDDCFALILGEQLNQPPFETYTDTVGDSGIGYVFKNVDSDGDGMIDDMEVMLGADPQRADTDGDAMNDGIEAPLTGPFIADPLTLETMFPADRPGIFRPSEAVFFRDINGDRFVTPSTEPETPFGAVGDRALVGDWDGEGTDQLGVFRPSDTGFYLDLNNNETVDVGERVAQLGQAGDTPLAGDWNGDGADELGSFRPSTNAVFLDLNGNGVIDGGETFANLGQMGDLPVVGDWNGDGTDQLGVYRPSNVSFYLDQNANRQIEAGEWVMAIVGDWNNDGRTEMGVYRPGQQRFFLDVNGLRHGPYFDVIIGAPNDVPLAGNW